VFYRGAVAELSPEPAREAVGSHLTTLVRRELIRPHATEFSDETYRFRHILIRDAAYEAMPKETRAELHERFAGWLEARAGERLREYEELLGYHLEQAHRYRAELGPVDDRGREVARRAGMLLGRAGKRAAARGDVSGSVNLLSRAVDLLPREDPERVHLLPQLGEMLVQAAEFGRALDVLQEASDQVDVVGDRVAAVRGELVRISHRLSTDPSAPFGALAEQAQQLLAEAEELGDLDLLIHAQHDVAMLLFWAGSASAATELLERAVPTARERGARKGQLARLHQAMVAPIVWGHVPADRGRDLCEQLLSEATGAMEAWLRGGIAITSAMQGDFDRAREQSSRGEAILEEFGMTLTLAAAHLPAEIDHLAGDEMAVEAAIRPGIEILRKAGETGFLSTSAVILAHALYAQGRYDEAEEYARLAEETAAPGDVASQMGWRSARAKILARQGRLEEAEPLAQEAARIARGTDHLTLRGDVLTSLAEVLHLAGKTAEAVRAVEEAVEVHERKGNVVSAGRARQFLEELASEG